MRKFIYLSKPWIDHIFRQIPSDIVNSIAETLSVDSQRLNNLINPIQEMDSEGYGIQAGIAERHLQDCKGVGSINLGKDYLAGVLPMRHAIFYDYQSSVAFFGGNVVGEVALIGSAEGFINPVEKIEDQNAAGGFYGMVQFNLMSDNPDENASRSFQQEDTDLYAKSLCKAINQLPSNETHLKFLARKLYVKNIKNASVAVGLPIYVALGNDFDKNPS